LSQEWRDAVVKFWFGLKPEQWWNGGTDLDHRIKQDFLKLWSEKRQLPSDNFLDEPLTALAAVILFDQFPRNIFRGHADQFATDHLALAIAKEAINEGFDERLAAEQRAFLYMPFQHSEDMDDQNRSMLLFTGLGDAINLKYAKEHHEVIERFGRFPHRNAILGRAPRPGEIAAGKVVPW
jgi:uncharacterized protein (DUF924 family)